VVDPGEKLIEFHAVIVLYARRVVLLEVVASTGPGASDVDHEVPYGRPDLRQKREATGYRE
jgi:hypothetical protein